MGDCKELCIKARNFEESDLYLEKYNTGSNIKDTYIIHFSLFISHN